MIYTSCFIAVPLPKKFQENFEEILKKLRDISPDIRTTNPTTPHITLYYLNKQSQKKIDKISDTVTSYLPIKTSKIYLNGMGLFTINRPRVLYLKVEKNKRLINLNEAFRTSLAEFNATDNRPGYTPHLTLARIKNTKEFLKNQSRISNYLQTIEFSFHLTEIAIYGAKTDKENLIETQEILKVIKI